VAAILPHLAHLRQLLPFSQFVCRLPLNGFALIASLQTGFSPQWHSKLVLTFGRLKSAHLHSVRHFHHFSFLHLSNT
jgi:hypothetical protein